MTPEQALIAIAITVAVVIVAVLITIAYSILRQNELIEKMELDLWRIDAKLGYIKGATFNVYELLTDIKKLLQGYEIRE